ncbi:hypothetical protein ROHU_029597 [Xyrichtys novacula]|uniref:Uncharacterized protein n=1 Tax=Xyrichtys novacula TaxID=13765 RepID=A0AAV1FF61_XYRNO|nr:hypothetical protein ROHU_029597 [Xyrichtys novacula]
MTKLFGTEVALNSYGQAVLERSTTEPVPIDIDPPAVPPAATASEPSAATASEPSAAATSEPTTATTALGFSAEIKPWEENSNPIQSKLIGNASFKLIHEAALQLVGNLFL